MMTRANIVGTWLSAVAIVLGAMASVSQADPFTSSYTDGTAWNVIYGTGFRPWINDGQDPGLVEDQTVPLSRFEFYFSEYDITLDTNDHDGDGLDDDLVESTNIRLAIVNNFFVNLQTLTTSSPELAGLSTNTIASTTGMSTGDPLQFDFSGVDLTYSSVNWYAAILVNEGEGGVLTPVLVPTIVANYSDDPNVVDDPEDPLADDTFPPATNYGEANPASPTDYFLSVTNYHHTDAFGTYFDTWTYYADANFTAYYDTEFPAGLPGDYNGNNKVDAADYTAWRDAMTAGLTTLPNRDPMKSGVVDEDDFLFWRMHFGEVLGSGAAAGSGSQTVPEPTSAVLVWLAAAAACWNLRKCDGRRPCH